jgi:hypothetical protein
MKKKSVKKKSVKKMVAAPAAKKYISGADAVNICEAKIVDIYIPGWDSYVRGKVPSPKAIQELRLKASTQEEFQEKLFRACLIDFKEEDFAKLEEANGLRYYELMTAVIENTDLFSQAMTKDNIKK